MNTKQIGFCIELAHAEDTLRSTKEELRQINRIIQWPGTIGLLLDSLVWYLLYQMIWIALSDADVIPGVGTVLCFLLFLSAAICRPNLLFLFLESTEDRFPL